jgi:hypothetical protein
VTGCERDVRGGGSNNSTSCPASLSFSTEISTARRQAGLVCSSTFPVLVPGVPWKETYLHTPFFDKIPNSQLLPHSHRLVVPRDREYPLSDHISLVFLLLGYCIHPFCGVDEVGDSTGHWTCHPLVVSPYPLPLFSFSLLFFSFPFSTSPYHFYTLYSIFSECRKKVRDETNIKKTYLDCILGILTDFTKLNRKSPRPRFQRTTSREMSRDPK